ncbi:hypothetical protein EYV94_06965 [Puteibacter caeruleilacunae]|nr:hypothetical protein EYV94_06965 [Puteibacter caeruleilacunae]
MNDFGIAFQLLGIGMTTVFIILSLVVVIGNLIIRVVNRLVLEEKGTVKGRETSESLIDKKKLSAIMAAVNIATNGKATVVDITKAN